MRWCFPHHYVGEWDGRLGIYCQPGNRGKVMRRAPGGSYLERWVTDVPPNDHVLDTLHTLRFMRPGDSHTVEVSWNTSWSLVGWYVNLQAPLVVHGTLRHTDCACCHGRPWRWGGGRLAAVEPGRERQVGGTRAGRRLASHRRATLADRLGGLAPAGQLGPAPAAGRLAPRRDRSAGLTTLVLHEHKRCLAPRGGASRRRSWTSAA